MKAQKKKEYADPFNKKGRIDHLKNGYWERRNRGDWDDIPFLWGPPE